MIRSLVLAAVASVGALGATTANAGVSWSVNVNTPVVGTVVSGGPAYYEPGYYRPGYARVYAPVPVYRVAPPVAYYPAPVYYRPVPLVYPRYYSGYSGYADYPGWHHGYRHDHWEGHGRR